MPRPEKDVLGRLLRDGAGSTVALTRTAFLHGYTYLSHIKPMVHQESLVLARHHGHRHVDGHGIERHPMVAQPNLLAPANLLGATDKHQRCDVDGTPPIEYNEKDCAPKEQEHNPLEKLLYFLEYLHKRKTILLQRTGLSSLDHGLACIEVNLYTTASSTILLATGIIDEVVGIFTITSCAGNLSSLNSA